MSAPVFEAKMTLDASQYLQTNDKAKLVAQQIELVVKKQDVAFQNLLKTLRPLTVQTQQTQRFMEQLHKTTGQLTAANAPAATALSKTAQALSGVAGNAPQTAMATLASRLARITAEANSAASSIGQVASSAIGAGGALDEASAPGSGGPARDEHGRFTSGAAYSREASAVAKGTSGEERELKEETADLDKLVGAVNRLVPAQQKAATEGVEMAKSENAVANSGRTAAAAAKQLTEALTVAGAAARTAGDAVKSALLAVPELAAFVTVVGSVGAAVEKMRSQFEYGDELNALSRQTGETAESIALMRRTFEYFDVPADEVGHTIFMLQRALGGVSEEGNATGAVFGRLGLSITELKKMDAAHQFAAMAAGLQKLPDQATRSAAAMQIFGRGALEVQAILNADPADFAQALKEGEEYSRIMGQNAGAFEEIERKFYLFGEQVNLVFARIAVGLVPAVQKLLDLVNEVDFSGWAKSVGDVIYTLSEGFAEGKLGEILFLSLDAGVIKVVEHFTELLAGTVGGLAAAFQTVFNKDFWSALGSGFKSLAEAFGATLLTAIGPIISQIQGSMDYLLARKQSADNATSAQSNAAQQYATAKTEEGRAKALNEAASREPNKKIADDWRNEANQHLQNAAIARNQGAVARDEANKYTDASNMSMSDWIAAHPSQATWYNQTSGQLGQSAELDARNAELKAKPTSDAWQEGMQKGIDLIKNSGFFTGALQNVEGQLRARIQSLIPPSSAPSTPQPKGNNLAPAANSLNYKMPDADRLAKIGLFVGGSPAAAGLSELKRTAKATEDTAKYLWRMMNLSQTRPPVATYA